MANRSISSITIKQGHTTVDPQDVERHSKQSEDWWNLSYLLLNEKRNTLRMYSDAKVPFIRDGLVPPSLEDRKLTPLSNKTILDVGCGGGILTEALAAIGANMTGIDASKELIEVAKKHSNINQNIVNNKPTYYYTTVEEHSQQFCNHYDAVVASEIIEHVTDKELFLESCVKALKPGGKIFITTPSRTRVTQIFGIFLAEYILGLIPKGTHQYNKLMTPDELTVLLNKNNCRVEMIHGITFNPLTTRFSFNDSKQMTFAVKAVKYVI